MKQIPLTQGKFAIVDDSDFRDLSDCRWHLGPYGYAVRTLRLNGKIITIYMHRVILGVTKGEEVDHANMNPLDNRRSNLRKATNQQNSYNRAAYRNNKSGRKGVCWNKESKNWLAAIRVNGRLINLGRFDDIEQAALAYRDAATKYAGEFARW